MSVDEEYLEVEGINSYYGTSHILQDVSIYVDKNEFVSLLGRNGAGKSTVIKAIMGIVDTRTGSIRFQGQELLGKSPHMIAQLGIGYVPADRGVFTDLTVEENLRVGGLNAAQKLDWEDLLDLFPVLEERLGQTASTMSGGEQQMLVLARAMMGDPDLLLVDEPFEGLQPSYYDNISSILETINDEGKTIIMVEQSPGIISRLSDRIYILENGGIKSDVDSTEISEPEELVGMM